MHREAGDEPETSVVEKRHEPGDRVFQIPLEWPARCGAVLDMNSDAVLIGWDDGRREWIEDEDIRPLRIWFIGDAPMREPKAGPLEIQLSKFMGGDPQEARRAPETRERSTSGRVLTFPPKGRS
jgi:hypothetical protein